jgi:hypothetical protein
MDQQIGYPDYQEALEYHGNTTVEITRRSGGRVIWKDWLIFDSVEEAIAFYNEAGNA